jgi:hypothetical protein
VVLDRVAKNPASHAVWYSSKSHVVVGETGIIRVFAIASAYVLSPVVHHESFRTCNIRWVASYRWQDSALCSGASDVILDGGDEGWVIGYALKRFQ